MATKKPKAPAKTAATKPNPRNQIAVALRYKGDKPDDALAYHLSRPEVQAAATIQKFQGDNHEVNSLVGELTMQVDAVNRADMRRPEAMLTAQAHTLDELFNNFARRSHSNMEAGYLEAAERYMRLALKAQSQCRTTVEALAEIKNPRHVSFVKQANIAHGHQQVNNGVQGSPPAHGNNSIPSNELSGVGNELLPDTRASSVESAVNPPVEALAELDRAAN